MTDKGDKLDKLLDKLLERRLDKLLEERLEAKVRAMLGEEREEAPEPEARASRRKRPPAPPIKHANAKKGETFGSLTATGRNRRHQQPSGPVRQAQVDCTCGKRYWIRVDQLRVGAATACSTCARGQAQRRAWERRREAQECCRFHARGGDKGEACASSITEAMQRDQGET